jgi:hypothetical protein
MRALEPRVRGARRAAPIGPDDPPTLGIADPAPLGGEGGLEFVNVGVAVDGTADLERAAGA